MRNAQSIALDSQELLNVEHIDTVLEVMVEWEKSKKYVLTNRLEH